LFLFLVPVHLHAPFTQRKSCWHDDEEPDDEPPDDEPPELVRPELPPEEPPLEEPPPEELPPPESVLPPLQAKRTDEEKRRTSAESVRVVMPPRHDLSPDVARKSERPIFPAPRGLGRG
jgi:hypothetical protein